MFSRGGQLGAGRFSDELFCSPRASGGPGVHLAVRRRETQTHTNTRAHTGSESEPQAGRLARRAVCGLSSCPSFEPAVHLGITDSRAGVRTTQTGILHPVPSPVVTSDGDGTFHHLRTPLPRPPTPTAAPCCPHRLPPAATGFSCQQVLWKFIRIGHVSVVGAFCPLRSHGREEPPTFGDYMSSRRQHAWAGFGVNVCFHFS